MSLVTYLECLPGLALAWLLIIGVAYLNRIISDPYPRPRARSVQALPLPEPEPVNRKGRLSDPNDLASWVPVSHDDVLFFLSQRIRGDFQESPHFNITLIENEPAGSFDTDVQHALRRADYWKAHGRFPEE